FLVQGTEENAYIEVKTVHPRTEDSEENLRKFEKRRELHPQNVHYIVSSSWLGAAIYGNSFSSRSKFMEYTLEFEDKLVKAKEIRSGDGVLVFCGNGFAWHRDELEDFAHFYRTDQHRSDDPFSRMERHAIVSGEITLRRNITALGYLKRGHDRT